jgi:hypothetical protein
MAADLEPEPEVALHGRRSHAGSLRRHTAAGCALPG